MDDYRALLVERARPPRAEAAPKKRDDRRDRAEARQATAPLRRAAREAEALVQKLLAERAKLETRLADPALYVPGKASEVTAANTRLAAIAREIDAAELAWLEAEEAMEQSI
jgi:ATP-binding cassette subfamily F protein 3